MLRVYVDPRTGNCRKLLAGLNLIGLPFDQHRIDYIAGAHKQPEYLKINPNGTLPAATDGELVLWESNAILQYAADLRGINSHYPSILKQRADVNRWMFWENGAWAPSNYIIFVENVAKPFLYNLEPDDAVIAKEMPNWHRLAGILDERLGQSKWLTGDEVTIADIAIAAPVHMHREARLPLEDHANLWRWMTEGIEHLPCWKESQKAMEAAHASAPV